MYHLEFHLDDDGVVLEDECVSCETLIEILDIVNEICDKYE